MKEKTFLNYYLPSALFNIFELVVIFMVGIIFAVDVKYILAIFVAFILNKCIFGMTMHYKDWYVCLIWSTLLFASFYILSKVSIELAVFSTFTYVFLSERTNIRNLDKLFLWDNSPNKKSKYDDIEEYIKYNSLSDDLISFEDKLKDRDALLYMVYKYRFKDKLTFKEISEKLDGMDNPRIVEKLDSIALAIRMYCKI